MKTSWLITGILVTCGVGVSVAACGSSSTSTTGPTGTSTSTGTLSSTSSGSPTATSSSVSSTSSGGNGGSLGTSSSSGVGGGTTTTSSTSSSSSGTCKVFSPYPAKMADGGGYLSSLYCPFSGVDGGKASYCDPGTEHCCETPTGSASPSACEPTGTACISGSVDWGCENPTADCASGQVCCTLAAAALVASTIDAGSCAYSTKPNITGTACTTQSACTTLGGLFLCGQDSECAAVGLTHCVPVYRDGNEFAACQ